MKRAWLVLALAIPAAAGAAGIPAPQAVLAPAKPAAHRPLFEVKYVLLPAPRTTGDLPRIDYREQSATIAPSRLDGHGSRELRPFSADPNVEIYRQWACETLGHR